MNPATARAPERAKRLRIPRYPVAVPVDVTVLRSGVPDSIPGRSLNLSEGGLAVVLAGEIRRGDPVVVEFRLPHVALPLHAKAVVRHQAQLRCGLEFLSLSLEQQAMIRYWAGLAQQKQPEIQASLVSSPPETLKVKASLSDAPPSLPRQPTRRRALWLALAMLVVIGGLSGWRWYRTWNELESRIPGKGAGSARQRARPIKIPAEVMEPLLTHKVEPIYPDVARQANLQGIVVLDVMIGPDGAVEDLRPSSGPDVLVPAAVDAVKWWRFQPYRLNGTPVEVETTVAVEFRPAS
jgi:TonB family protein